MRRNPRLFKHPDMFSREETPAFAPLESLSREEIARIPFENFSAKELDAIAEDDYDLYEEIMRSSGAEERRDEIIEKIEEWAKGLAESEKEYRTSESEWAIDYFQEWLQDAPDIDELTAFASEQLGDDLSDLPEDQLEEILKDPYIYEVRSEADANEYRTYSDLWQVFEREAETQIEGNGYGEELFDLLRDLKPYLSMEDTKRLVERAFDRAYVYTDISHLFDTALGKTKTRYLSAYITVVLDVMHFAELNVEELQERLAELSKSEKRIKRDDSEQNIVYQFDDGDYVADLRSEQLRTEGRMQRHCVGRPGMGYARSVQDGEIKIFSLRTPNAKAILTIEVTLDRQGRPTKIPQVLGFTNRLPGFEAGRGHSEVTKPEEVRKVAEFIRDYLRLDPYEAKDLRPALEVVEGSRGGARANPGGLPVPPRLQRLADARHERAVARMRD
jgi:hypothetical protein